MSRRTRKLAEAVLSTHVAQSPKLNFVLFYSHSLLALEKLPSSPKRIPCYVVLGNLTATRWELLHNGRKVRDIRPARAKFAVNFPDNCWRGGPGGFLPGKPHGRVDGPST